MTLLLDHTNAQCSVAACERKVYAKTVCKLHYARQRSGIPLDRPLFVPALRDENLGYECPACGRLLTKDDFYKATSRTCGVQGHCKDCMREAQKQSKRDRRAAGKIAYSTASYRRMRLEVLTAYSGGEPRCSCCDERRIEFLSIDHVNGGGSKHRRDLGNNAHRTIYLELKRRGYPAGFRVLCHNCNVAHGLYGYCPHHDPDATTERWLTRPGRRLGVQH